MEPRTGWNRFSVFSSPWIKSLRSCTCSAVGGITAAAKNGAAWYRLLLKSTQTPRTIRLCAGTGGQQPALNARLLGYENAGLEVGGLPEHLGLVGVRGAQCAKVNRQGSAFV